MLSDTFPSSPSSRQPDAICIVLSLSEETKALRFDVSRHSVSRCQNESCLTKKFKHFFIQEVSFFLNKVTTSTYTCAF